MASDFDEIGRRIINRACGDIGESMHPFRDMAEDLDLSEQELLGRLEFYLTSGVLRRFGAVLYHREAGYTANGMSVWNVPDDEVARAGLLVAAYRQVSHCYERPRIEDCPYNLYAMIHERTRERCLFLAAEIAEKIGIGDYQVLFSTREFKKSSVIYFLESLEERASCRDLLQDTPPASLTAAPVRVRNQ